MIQRNALINRYLSAAEKVGQLHTFRKVGFKPVDVSGLPTPKIAAEVHTLESILDQ